MQEINSMIKGFLRGKENQHMNNLKHCNFTQSFINYLESNDISISNEEIMEGEKESYVDRYGTFKYKQTLKIKEMDLKVQVSCLFKNEWEFYFEELMNPNLEIKKERVIKHNNDKSVFLLFEQKMYLLPLDIAEELDLEEFHNKDIDADIKKSIIGLIEGYEIKDFIKIN